MRLQYFFPFLLFCFICFNTYSERINDKEVDGDSTTISQSENKKNLVRVAALSENDGQIGVIPNHESGDLNIDFKNSMEENYIIELFDLHGKSVFRHDTHDDEKDAIARSQHYVFKLSCGYYGYGSYSLSVKNKGRGASYSYKVEKIK